MYNAECGRAPPLDGEGTMRVCTLGSATAMVAAMACRGATACPGDIDCDRQTAITDFLLVLANWGTTGPGDIAGAPGGGPNGIVGIEDLLAVLADWGCADPVPGFVGDQRVLGPQQYLVLRVKYPGKEEPDPISFAAATGHSQQVSDALVVNSYGRASVTFDITPILLMPQPATFYESGSTLTAIRADAVKLAEQLGFDVDSYEREVIWSRKLWNGATALGSINFRSTFVSGGNGYLWTHELGHSYGWRHANFWSVKGGNPDPGFGTEVEYGDRFDSMGDTSSFHHFNPLSKQRGGWLAAGEIQEITQSGTYSLRSIEGEPQPGGLPSALRVRRTADSDYWIFHRASEPLVNNGPVITVGFRDNVRPTRLLDMTPGSIANDWEDAALVPGETFASTFAPVEITTVSSSPDGGATVQVVLGGGALDTPPVIGVVHPTPGVTLSGQVTYRVTAFDPDAGVADGCGIDTLHMWLHPITDQVIGALRQGLDPPTPVAAVVHPISPFELSVDTTQIVDGWYLLVVRATGADGGTILAQFQHLIDNTGPSF